MTSIRDKNLLFYSIHPSDQYSKEFLNELDKYPNLKKQFILICVNDPNIKIPDKVKQLNKVPVLVAAGFSRPILGNDAVSWLKNGGLQDKANGFDYGALNDDNSSYAYLTDDLKPSDYNQFYNSDYNHGFTEKDSILNHQFSKLNDNAHITTFDDTQELKKDISGQLEQRLSILRQQRDADVPRAIKRIGGLDDQVGSGQTFQNSNSRQDNGSGLVYNPNQFNNGGPQLPFNMPSVPSMPNMPNMNSHDQRQNPLPILPFNMPNFNQRSQNQQLPPRNMPQLPFQMNKPQHYKNVNL